MRETVCLLVVHSTRGASLDLHLSSVGVESVETWQGLEPVDLSAVLAWAAKCSLAGGSPPPPDGWVVQAVEDSDTSELVERRMVPNA